VVSDPLGGFALPLSKGAPKGGSGSEWHALGAVTGMGKIVPSGFMKLGFAVSDMHCVNTSGWRERELISLILCEELNSLLTA